MDLNAVLLNYGSVLEAGRSAFVWNADGTLAIKRLFSDPAKTELIYTKEFTWNLDGTLNHWIFTVATTNEVVRKDFIWNADGSLQGATVTP